MVIPSFELEKDVMNILRLVREKLDKEKKVVANILQNYRWIPLDKDITCKCAAVDSSFLIIESRIGFIYVIQGVTVLYTIENNLAKRVGIKSFSDAGFIDIQATKSHFIAKKSIYKKVLTEYAYTLELNNLLNITEELGCDLALLDGSFISFIMDRRIKDSKVYIESVKNVYSLEEIEEYKIKSFEKLFKHRYTVFLAKSSSAGFYTQGLYPDMYILELARLYKIEPYSSSGFLEPLTIDVKNVLSKYVKEFNIPTNEFTITYIRLSPGIPVYQLTFPYKMSEDDLKYVFMCLKKYSPTGYPMPLEYVHKLSKLPRRKLINTMMMIGIPIVSGRELIELN